MNSTFIFQGVWVQEVTNIRFQLVPIINELGRIVSWISKHFYHCSKFKAGEEQMTSIVCLVGTDKYFRTEYKTPLRPWRYNGMKVSWQRMALSHVTTQHNTRLKYVERRIRTLSYVLMQLYSSSVLFQFASSTIARLLFLITLFILHEYAAAVDCFQTSELIQQNRVFRFIPLLFEYNSAFVILNCIIRFALMRRGLFSDTLTNITKSSFEIYFS